MFIEILFIVLSKPYINISNHQTYDTLRSFFQIAGVPLRKVFYFLSLAKPGCLTDRPVTSCCPNCPGAQPAHAHWQHRII